MRMMLRWTAPVEKGNEGLRDGSAMKVIESLLDELDPEAAYFYAEGGRRAGMMVFDMTDSSQIPEVAEPLFNGVDAAVEIFPVMNPDDLRRALQGV